MDGPEGHDVPAWWTPWAKLGLPGRVGRALAIAFTVFHLSAMFAMGATAKVRERFAPIFGFYEGRLKMTNTWGMFSKRPSSMHVRIEAVDDQDRVTVISDTHAVGKSILTRFRDGRLRKIQTKLGSPKERIRFGSDYLDGWCRYSASKLARVTEVRAVRETHELRDDRGAVTRPAEESVVLRRTCGRGRPRTLAVEREVENDDDDGVDH